MNPALSRVRVRSFPGVIVVAALTLLALAGCGQPAPTAAAPSGTRAVVDMTGRHVQIPTDVTRVATDYPALNATLLVLGAADRVVATSPGVGPLFSTLVPSYTEVPQPFDASLSKVNEEQLLSTRPQVVFLSPGARPLLPTFDRLGIPAVVFASFQNPEQLKTGVELVADILGGQAPAKAQAFARYYEADIARVTAKIDPIPPGNRPGAYYTAANPTQTEGQNSIVDIWMNQGGARNVAAANGVNTAPAFADVTLEDVLRWNPDFIICRDGPTRAQILGDPRWRTVAAVRTNNVLINPKGVYVWSVRSAESALQPLWAAKTFHPELFTDIDMNAEVKRFYQQFYNYTLTDQQTAAILNPATS